MPNRENAGILAMIAAFLVLMGGMTAYVLVNNIGSKSARPAAATAPTSPMPLTMQNTGVQMTGQTGGGFATMLAQLSLFTSSIERNPGVAVNYVGRAKLYEQTGDYEAAIADFSTAIELGETDHQTYTARARLHERMESFDLALADYDGAIADRRSPAALAARGQLRKKAGDHEGAVDDLSEAIRLQPGRGPNLARNLAWAQWGTQDYEGALATINAAIGTHHGKSRLHDYKTRGVTYYHLGRMHEAKADFEAAARIGGTGVDYARYSLWFAMAHLGEREQADRQLRRYVENADEMEIGGWSLEIGRFLLGDLTEDDFLTEARAGEWMGAAEQMCEAHYYAGAMLLLAGEREAATAHFRVAVSTGVTSYYEHFRASTELARLNGRTVSSAP